MPGFLAPEKVARTIKAADAVILPYREGGGVWNTSLSAASRQGTFVITTSAEREGYDADKNIFYARPGDIPAMRAALAAHAGRKIEPADGHEWDDIAQAHIALYQTLLNKEDAE